MDISRGRKEVKGVGFDANHLVSLSFFLSVTRKGTMLCTTHAPAVSQADGPITSVWYLAHLREGYS